MTDKSIDTFSSSIFPKSSKEFFLKVIRLRIASDERPADIRLRDESPLVNDVLDIKGGCRSSGEMCNLIRNAKVRH